ncbi:MAG: hypothetical protein ACI4JF_01545 [Oscillospiraceae bacterium]
MYSGLIIKESIGDENLFDIIDIVNVEIWKTNNKPKYWTAVSFTSSCDDFPRRLAEALVYSPQGITWYVDFQDETYKYIVLKDTVLKYHIGNEEEKSTVCRKCIELGVPKEQLDWSE